MNYVMWKTNWTRSATFPFPSNTVFRINLCTLSSRRTISRRVLMKPLISFRVYTRPTDDKQCWIDLRFGKRTSQMTELIRGKRLPGCLWQWFNTFKSHCTSSRPVIFTTDYILILINGFYPISPYIKKDKLMVCCVRLISSRTSCSSYWTGPLVVHVDAECNQTVCT